MLLEHHAGIFNYYEYPVRFGVVEAINGNIKLPLRRGRGYKNRRYFVSQGSAHAGHNDGIGLFPHCRVESGVGFLVQSLKAISPGSYLIGRILIVRQYLRPSCPVRPVHHLVARVGLASLNSADVSKSQLPPLARIAHHYNVETAEILGCRVRKIAFWQPFQEI
jgi:hypothetical protein